MGTVWQRLVDLLGAGAVTICADQVRPWDKNQWREILGLGLLREAELAESVFCYECGDPHFADIYWEIPGAKACCGCPVEGVIDIEIDRLRQWRIDADRMAGLVAGSLDLSAPIDVLLRERLWRIGRRRLGGRYRDIFFGVGAGWPVAEMSAAIRSSIGPGSALLLTAGADGNPDGIPAGQHRLDLASVSRVEGGRVVIDLDYVEERLAGEAPSTRKPSRTIPVPAGASWRDISIIVFDGLLQITVCGKVYEIEFAELGVNERSQPIELLKLFAAARGTLDTAQIQDLVSGDAAVKMRVRRLRQLLQELIGVDGDPIENHRKAKAYVCRFEIRLAGDDGFRTPAGVTWLDLAFHERVDGRILVTAPERRQIRARGAQNRSGESVEEVAEERGTVTRTYSLEEMGLRTEAGRLTSEGAAFTDLLRAGGMLPRGGNDVVVLELAARLREWTGLDGEPLRLLEASRSWTAVFACSSEIKVAKGTGAVSGTRARPGEDCIGAGVKR
jgi:hypothetical protein